MVDIKQYIHNFGLKIFVTKVIRSRFYNNYSKFGIELSKVNEKNIKEFLQKNIVNNLKEYEDNTSLFRNNNVSKNKVIWTMWWQGMESAPKIVKACINNLISKNDARVIIITKDNYDHYVHLDKKIINMFKLGKISITHFSDIIRTNLLYLYGGTWIDSTVWITKKIEDSVFCKDFYTIKTGKYTNDPSHGRWTTFFMETKAGNETINFVRQCFNTYCSKYDMFIDYILFDYFIALACQNNIIINNQISKIEINNTQVFKLQTKLNETYDVSFFDNSTYLYKLTYKKNFFEKSKNGKRTFYSMVIKENYEE